MVFRCFRKARRDAVILCNDRLHGPMFGCFHRQVQRIRTGQFRDPFSWVDELRADDEGRKIAIETAHGPNRRCRTTSPGCSASCRPSLLLCHHLALSFPVPRQETFQIVGFHFARDDAFQHIGKPDLGVHTIQFAGVDERCEDRESLATAGTAHEQRILLVRATDFIVRSTTLEPTSIRPSSRKAASPLQWLSV